MPPAGGFGAKGTLREIVKLDGNCDGLSLELMTSQPARRHPTVECLPRHIGECKIELGGPRV
jgi:hypothetical protein